jgi:hypothetical protein
MSFVRFHIIPSPDSSYHVMINKFSAGRSNSDVNERAEKIQYHASYANGTLDLGSGFAIDKGSKYRGQMVEVEIKVPAGKKIRFDESVRHKLNPVNIRVHKNRGWRRGRVGISVDDYDSFPWDVNTDYIMGTDGELRNADGTPVKSNQYRYQDDDSIQIEKSIEEKKNELKELELQRKEQIQQKQKNSSSKDSAKTEKMEDGDDSEFNIKGTPIFSLVQLFY